LNCRPAGCIWNGPATDQLDQGSLTARANAISTCTRRPLNIGIDYRAVEANRIVRRRGSHVLYLLADRSEFLADTGRVLAEEFLLVWAVPQGCRYQQVRTPIPHGSKCAYCSKAVTYSNVCFVSHAANRWQSAMEAADISGIY
jgi:hypothetical protein